MIDQIIRRLFGRTPSGNLLKETKALAGAIPLIAQALVNRRGHKIRLVRGGGRGGRTDGKTIEIEDTPIPQSANDLDAFVRYTAVQLGLVHHEIGHVNYTDFSAKRSTDRFTNFLENIIEDVRQERIHISCIRNGRDALDAMGLVLDSIPEPDPVLEPSRPLETVFTSWLLRTLRSHVRGEGHLREGAARARTVLEERFGHDLVKATERLIAKVPYLTSTAQAIALAADIVTELRKHQQQHEQHEQQSQQAAAQQPEDDTPSEADDQQNTAGSPNQPGNTPPSSGDAQQTLSSQQGQGQADPSAQPGNQPNPSPTQPDPTMNQNGPSPATATDPSNGSAANAGQGTPVDHQALAQAIANMLAGDDLDGSGDRAEQAQALMQGLRQDLANHGVAMSEFDPDVLSAAFKSQDPQSVSSSIDVEAGVSEVHRVRSVLNKHLQAQSFAKSSRSDRGSKLVTKALVRVPMGDARLFAKHHPARLLDTAIVIAMDCSGSMGTDSRIVLADQAAYATACALETLPGCQLSVIAFPDHHVVLRFGQRARKHRLAFAQRARGGTPMHEAVQMATVLLARRSEPRKLLMVVTDGQPDSTPHTEMALLAARRMGVEAMAIGIKIDIPSELFACSARVNQMAELSTAMLTMLGDRMLSVRAAA